MNDYAAYGLIFRSALSLPELVEASALDSTSTPRPKGNADVLISLTPPAGHSAAELHSSKQTWATPDRAFIAYPGVASFLISAGREISIHIQAGVDERLVRLYLLGPVLALLLHQREFLVLHASAVNLRGRAIAFVGDKGMGKSTMAAALHARGHALVADDLVAVDMHNTPPTAYPGFPQLKLFPESAALLDEKPLELPKVHPHIEKRARHITSGFITAPLPLRHVFVLTDGDAEFIEPLSARQAFMQLVRHSFLLGFLKATGSAETHFRQATALSRRISVARLVRRRSFDALANVAALVEGQIERAA